MGYLGLQGPKISEGCSRPEKEGCVGVFLLYLQGSPVTAGKQWRPLSRVGRVVKDPGQAQEADQLENLTDQGQ